ncbi:hypothetical protein LCGC14_1113280 [marine sediment metagenome]|uniref:Uncharacterized protein n=1 Tax=marine sediment metagenome TaxID=412755 RepID=A0A0F9MU30_9ZZZZ
MSDGNGKPAPEQPTKFNIIRFRGDPKTATTLSGHHVEKKSHVVVPNPMDIPDHRPVMVKMADYHMEHFVYVDPLFEKPLHPNDPSRYWWLMCTCGSKAQLVGLALSMLHEGLTRADLLFGKVTIDKIENLIVCEYYLWKLITENHGYHQGQDPKPWV